MEGGGTQRFPKPYDRIQQNSLKQRDLHYTLCCPQTSKFTQEQRFKHLWNQQQVQITRWPAIEQLAVTELSDKQDKHKIILVLMASVL